MKKILVCSLIFSLLVCFASCNSNKAPDDSSPTPTAVSTEALLDDDGDTSESPAPSGGASFTASPVTTADNGTSGDSSGNTDTATQAPDSQTTATPDVTKTADATVTPTATPDDGRIELPEIEIFG